MSIKVYKDNENLIFVTNEKNIIRKLKELAPEAFEAFELLDLAPSTSNPKMKEAEPPSPFGNGTYHGLRPSDYVERFGVDGALQMSGEKGIPDDMKGEIIRVCAPSIKRDLEEIKDRDVSTSEFIRFTKRYDSMIGLEMKKVLSRTGCGTIENYCKEKSKEALNAEYKELCVRLIKRVSAAIS